MTTPRERWLGALLFGLLAVAFLWPGVASDDIPVCVDPLYRDARAVPFAPYRPDDHRDHNPFLSDQALVFYPWSVFMSEAVRSGQLPLWSPHSGCGMPYVANLSSAVFFPTTWLACLPPGIVSAGKGMLLGALVRLWVAGFFGYLLMRRLRAGPVAAATAGIVAMLFGYQVVWLFYSLSNVACMLPLCLYLAVRFVERPGALEGTLLAGALAVQFFGGHAETSLALCVAVTALVLARPVEHAAPLGLLLRRYAWVGIGAVALASFQLFPFVEYLRISEGRAERIASEPPEPAVIAPLGWPGLALGAGGLLLVWHGWRALRRDGGPLRGLFAGLLLGGGLVLLRPLGLRPDLLLLCEPDLFGNPLSGVDPQGYRGPETYTDLGGGYAGVVALVLALLALIAVERSRLRNLFGALLVFAWILSGGIEPLRSIIKVLPPFNMTAHARMLPLSGMAIAVLAGLAVDELARGRGRRLAAALARLVPAAAIAALLLAVTPSADGLDDALDAAELPRVDLPAAGAVIRPGDLPWQERWAQKVAIRGTAPHGCARVQVFVQGEPLPFVAPDAEGRFESPWFVTRIEQGRYALSAEAHFPDGTVQRGAPVVVALDREPRLTAGGTWHLGFALLFVGVGSFVLGGRAASRAGRIGRAALLATFPVAVAAELFAFGADYNAYAPPEVVLPDTPLTRFLQDERARRLASGEGPFRVLPEDLILQPNLHYGYGFETIRSYDQLEIAAYNRLARLVFEPGTRFVRWSHRTVRSVPLLQLLNVEYLVAGARIDDVPWLEPLDGVAGGPGEGVVHRVVGALPRATVQGAIVFVDREADPLALDPRAAVFLDSAEVQASGVALPAPGGRGTARVTSYRLNEVAVDVDAQGAAMLLLTDNVFPGWKATVNGEPAPILRSHGTFRAVAVPDGASRVAFRFVPWSFFGGAWLAAAALVIALALVYRSPRGKVDLAR